MILSEIQVAVESIEVNSLSCGKCQGEVNALHFQHFINYRYHLVKFFFFE
jgi:hypothetical protein